MSGQPSPSDAPRLLCIPGAGSSAARFERLRAELTGRAELRTFELPGRGIRFAEPSPRLLTEHVTHFIERIEAEPYQRWILLGESLGALTATWLTRGLADSFRASVLGLITVAAAPQVTGRRPQQEVIDLLRADATRVGGDLPPAVAEAIKADIDAAHAVGPTLQPRPIDVPVSTIHGRDDGLISIEAAGGWENLARRGWMYHEVPGNHYQFEEPTTELITALHRSIDFVTSPHRSQPVTEQRR